MKAFTKSWGEDTANKTIYNDTQAGAGIGFGDAGVSANVNGTTYRSDEQIKVLSTELANVVTDRGGVLDGTGSNQVSQYITAEIQANVGLPVGFISGFVPALGADTDHDIDFGIGEARSSDNLFDIIETSTKIKQIDANWVEGSNVGGFPSGLTLSANTTYHLFVIMKDDLTTDAGFDSSLTAANLLTDATGYTRYRRVGSILTDASSNILQFTAIEKRGGGLLFKYAAPITDLSITASTQPTTYTVFNISIPSGVDIEPIIAILTPRNDNGNSTEGVLLKDDYQQDMRGSLANGSGDKGLTYPTGLITSLSQLEYKYIFGGASTANLDIETNGYIDERL